MSKEYHVFTHREPTFEQAFVFEVERDENFIAVGELWTVVTHKNGELKTRIRFDEMMDSIGHNVGGNIDDDGVSAVVDIFKDVLPLEKQIDIQVDLVQREIEENSVNSAERLIKASEYAESLNLEGNQQKLLDKLIEQRHKKK